MNNYLLFILVLIAITALILSIFSLNKCKDKFGGSVLNESECNNLGPDQKKTMYRRSKNFNN